ncbi:MAG: hypothetical protein ACREXM_07375 [Gammaproteobacteria bacterium]
MIRNDISTLMQQAPSGCIRDDGMTKAVAGRQPEYRARREKGEGARRLNTWISTHAYCALERLSKQCGMTKREMIELLVITADTDVSAILERYFGIPKVKQ